MRRAAFAWWWGMAVVLLLAGTASAQTGGVICERDCMVWKDTPRLITISVAPPCFTELLAASRAWAKMMSPGTWRKENDGALHQTWAFVDFRGDAQSAEQRWRKAVEACRP